LQSVLNHFFSGSRVSRTIFFFSSRLPRIGSFFFFFFFFFLRILFSLRLLGATSTVSSEFCITLLPQEDPLNGERGRSFFPFSQILSPSGPPFSFLQHFSALFSLFSLSSGEKGPFPLSRPRNRGVFFSGRIRSSPPSSFGLPLC